MPDAQDAIADISIVAEATEKISLFLDSIGIELSVFELQLAALVIALAVFVTLLLVAWKKPPKARYAAFAGLVPLLLVILFIVANWLDQWFNPLPDYISGQVVANDLHDMSIGLLGFRDKPFAAGPEHVDSITGRFALNYQPRLGDHPRRFLLKKAGCDDLSLPISYAGLAAEERFRLEFACQAAP